MGVSPSAFRKWLKGEAEPSRERLVALARATGVGVAWLAEGEGPAPCFESVGNPRRRQKNIASGDDPDWDQFVVLPDQAVAAGSGTSPAVTSPSGTSPAVTSPARRFIALRQDWLRGQFNVDPERVMLEIAADEAMAPTIEAGDVVLVDQAQSAVERPGIYLIEIGGQRMIRRVQRRHDGGMVLITDNKAYQADTVGSETAAGVTTIGRVVWAGGAI